MSECDCGRRDCKPCWARYMRDWYRKQSPEKRAAISRGVSRYKAENPEQVLLTRILTKRKNPTKPNARRCVEAAVAAGILRKPDSCEECGRPADPDEPRSIHAHHISYDMALCVEWLCPKCHATRHPRRRVECLICGAEITDSMMGRHVKACHEPS